MRKALFFAVVLLTNQGFAQLTLERQALSCFGLNYSGDYVISSTAGQVSYTTAESSNGFLTQGFHQPDEVNTIQLTLEVFGTECSDLFDAQITSVSGCEDLDGLIVLWNNTQGNMTQSGLPAHTMITLSTTSGCSYTTWVNLSTHPSIVVASCELEFYNYLSPNNDGDNDAWFINNIDNEEVKTASVQIFNRWGVLVWEGQQYDNVQVVWKGKSFNGLDLPDGTYYYLATVNDKKYNGYVELLR